MALHAPEKMILLLIFPILLFKISHLQQQVRLTGLTEEARCCSMVLPSQDGRWEREGALTPCTVHDIPLQSTAFLRQVVARIWAHWHGPELTLS